MYCQTRRTIGGRSSFLIRGKTTKLRHNGVGDFSKQNNVEKEEIEYYEANKPIAEKQSMNSLISKLGKVELTKKKRQHKNVIFKV